MLNLILAITLMAGFMGSDCSPYCGYTDQQGRWVPGYISNATWFMPYPRHSYGRAVWYGPSVMRATANWREMSLDGYVDGVAAMSCDQIGETIWLKRAGHTWDGPFLVVDCPRRGDAYSAVVFTEEVVEVGWATALRWGMVSGWPPHYRPAPGKRAIQWQVSVKYWVGEYPPYGTEEFEIQPVNYRDYWLDRVEFVWHHEKRPLFVPGGTFIHYDEHGNVIEASIHIHRSNQPAAILRKFEQLESHQCCTD